MPGRTYSLSLLGPVAIQDFLIMNRNRIALRVLEMRLSVKHFIIKKKIQADTSFILARKILLQ